jgi:RNA polymerase sigma-70 factor (ECF subfamily)
LKKRPTYKNDQELAMACARGNPRAQRLLYDTYLKAMYNTVYRYCFQKEVTEDILQIAFTKVFASIDQYDPGKGALKAWIRKICIHCAIDIQKKEIRQKPVPDDYWEISYAPLPLDQLNLEFLLKMIGKLPREMRVVFNLYEIEGYSHEEISTLTGMNVNSCRVYLSRAKKKLREQLESLEEYKKVKYE